MSNVSTIHFCKESSSTAKQNTFCQCAEKAQAWIYKPDFTLFTSPAGVLPDKHTNNPIINKSRQFFSLHFLIVLLGNTAVWWINFFFKKSTSVIWNWWILPNRYSTTLSCLKNMQKQKVTRHGNTEANLFNHLKIKGAC